jgi:hypothetical protein
MTNTAVLSAQVQTTGTLGETQNLVLTNLTLASTSNSATTYTLTPGQERECCAHLLVGVQPLLVKYYAIESNQPIEVEVKTTVPAVPAPTVYTQPAGKFFLWATNPTGSLLASIKIRSSAAATTNTDVVVVFGYG